MSRIRLKLTRFLVLVVVVEVACNVLALKDLLNGLLNDLLAGLLKFVWLVQLA